MVPAMRDPAGKGAAPHRRVRWIPGRIPGPIVLGAGLLGLELLGLGLLGAGIAQGGEGSAAPMAPGTDLEAPGMLGVTGIRVSEGDAVDCPRLRDDAGILHAVSYLPPRIAIGERVTVWGRLAVTTTCRGVVLVVEKLVEGVRGGGASGGG